MTKQDLLISTLIALFDFAQLDQLADAGTLASRTGVSATEVGGALLHLERKGLVDAGSMTLTMFGLSAASTLASHQRAAVRAA